MKYRNSKPELDSFIERIQKYTALEELTPYVAHELIKAIYVERRTKAGKRRQSIYIQYDLIGFIPLDELMKAGNGMTNAMPSLQMTIKLSYGWRPLARPVLVCAARCIKFFD